MAGCLDCRGRVVGDEVPAPQLFSDVLNTFLFAIFLILMYYILFLKNKRHTLKGVFVLFFPHNVYAGIALFHSVLPGHQVALFAQPGLQ